MFCAKIYLNVHQKLKWGLNQVDSFCSLRYAWNKRGIPVLLLWVILFFITTSDLGFHGPCGTAKTKPFINAKLMSYLVGYSIDSQSGGCPSWHDAIHSQRLWLQAVRSWCLQRERDAGVRWNSARSSILFINLQWLHQNNQLFSYITSTNPFDVSQYLIVELQ